MNGIPEPSDEQAGILRWHAPCLKAGDSGSWFCDSTYRVGLPLHDSGAHLPRRYPLQGGSLSRQRDGVLMPLGTAANNHYKTY